MKGTVEEYSHLILLQEISLSDDDDFQNIKMISYNFEWEILVTLTISSPATSICSKNKTENPDFH